MIRACITVLLLSGFFLSFSSISASAQMCDYISMTDVAGKNAPKFEAFPAMTTPGLRPAPVNLQSHPKARQYRTVLTEGAAAGPNFAGNLTIVGWGCGTSCLAWAVVDARSGKIYFPSVDIATISTVHVDEVGPDEPVPRFNGLRFRADSNLIALLGAPREDESREGILFYRWTGTTLKLVKAYKWCDAKK